MVWKILISLFVLVTAFTVVARKISSTVVVERTFNSPINQLWQVWNTPESIQKWWSPKNYTAPIIKNDFRIGGSFLLSMKAPNGDMHWNTGHYIEIIQNQKIVSAMSFSDENGNIITGDKIPVPGQWPDEIMVTTEFTELGDKTKVKVTEVGIPLIMKLFAKMGWEQQFDKLDQVLAAPAQ